LRLEFAVAECEGLQFEGDRQIDDGVNAIVQIKFTHRRAKPEVETIDADANTIRRQSRFEEINGGSGDEVMTDDRWRLDVSELPRLMRPVGSRAGARRSRAWPALMLSTRRSTQLCACWQTKP
jgi:hypothetical protein